MIPSKRKFYKMIDELYKDDKVIVHMVDGTVKTVSGKEWLHMKTDLIKHFEILPDGK